MTRIDDVLLMAYVDGELDAETAREIETTIAGDAAVAARARGFRDTAALSRSAFAGVINEPVPERLVRAASAGGAVAIPARRPTLRQFGWAMAAGIAALAIGVGGLFLSETLPVSTPWQSASFIRDGGSVDRWLNNVVGYYRVHEATLSKQDRLLVDFGAEDVPELEKWFGARLRRNLAVPDLSAAGFTMQGGRLLVLGGEPAAQFVYYSTSGELVTLAISITTRANHGPRPDRRNDVNVVHWTLDGYAYAFVGAVDAARLMELADRSSPALGAI